ncbi:MAG: TolB-like 6-bladed beta-propeller domain-containing protein [Prevotellaceae bacterium]|jgi:hypothetical protein|nr:TolB-like 6-bladed beta-propeller domain-containing protein [Prevotellaceae bacterium]
MENNKNWRHYINVVLGISFFSLVACSWQNKYQNSESIDLKDFEAIEFLKGNVITFDSMIMKPWLLQVYDTLLITCNLNTDKLFHVFDLKNRKQIAQRISMGQGPAEMLNPFFIPNDSVMMLFDLGKSIISKYNIRDFVDSSDPTPFEQIKLSEQIMGEMVLVEDGIIGSPYHPKHAFYKFDKSGNEMRIFGERPVSEITYSNIEIVDAYRSVLTSNSIDKVAVCYYWTDLIEIYDKDGKLKKRIHGPEHFYPYFKGYTDRGMIYTKTIPGKSRDAYYSPVSVGGNIFVLFNGKNPNEAGYNILAKRIFVFDWDGTPRKIYELDKGISNMDVDEKNKKIYGINDDPEYQIIEFSY